MKESKLMGRKMRYRLFVLMVLCSYTCPLAQSSDGAMFRINLRHTGSSEARGIDRFKEVWWRFKTGPVVEAWFSSPTLAHGELYFGCDDGTLYAVDAKTGRESWAFKTWGVIYSSPAVAGDAVVGTFLAHRSTPKVLPAGIGAKQTGKRILTLTDEHQKT